MSITYKDIDQLSQKSAVAGTEKIPVSDLEYITPSQMLANISEQLSALATQVNKLASREQFPQSYRDALLACFDDVDWSSANKETLMAALEEAMIDHGELISIEATYTQTATITIFNSLDDLKSDLVVTASYEDGFEKQIDDYTLSGTLEVGTSTITVTYEGKADTIAVTVVYKYVFKLSDGDVTKLKAATSLVTNTGWILNGSTTQQNRRRSFPVSVGVKCFLFTTQESNPTYTDSDYFPIPIPSDATSVSISLTPSSQYFAAIFSEYSNNAYSTALLDTGWKQGSHTISSIPSGATHMSVASKYNSSGSTYPTEPTELVITFNK